MYNLNPNKTFAQIISWSRICIIKKTNLKQNNARYWPNLKWSTTIIICIYFTLLCTTKDIFCQYQLQTSFYTQLETKLPVYNQIIDPQNLPTIQTHSQVPILSSLSLYSQHSPETWDASSSSSSSESLLEVGSGNYDQPGDDYNSQSQSFGRPINEDSASSSTISPSPVQVFNMDMSTATDVFHLKRQQNKAPLLVRRIPRLVITAGQYWKYFIPNDIFVDEDGNLRNLKSNIVRANIFASDNIDSSVKAEYRNEDKHKWASWIQYSEDSQMLSAFATERDLGRHMLLLIVTDKWGAVSEEEIEITVRQHPSFRAFTHSFIIYSQQWDFSKYPSIVDLLNHLTTNISRVIYGDTSKNLILESFELLQTDNNQPLDNRDIKMKSTNRKVSYRMTWSNQSLPIHPCNLEQIDQILKPLIDSRLLPSIWSIESGSKLMLMPSSQFMNTFETEFKPASVSYILQGACEVPDMSNHLQSNDNDVLKVKTRIGKLIYRLGEPFKFKIPSDTFSGHGSLHNDLLLTVHTIDGLPLHLQSIYDYMEFDKESQVIHGLPFDSAFHTGRRELQIIARHPLTGERARDVFIIDVRRPSLSAINNRHFVMSLYVIPRLGHFGPTSKYLLSVRMLEALKLHFKQNASNSDTIGPEFTVTAIQKFAVSSYLKKNPKLAAIFNSSDQNIDKFVRVSEKADYLSFSDEEPIRADPFDMFLASENMAFTTEEQQTMPQPNFFYRFSWTNETMEQQGDCPVEAIKQNILYSLEQSMLAYNEPKEQANANSTPQQMPKNDTERFYERLKEFFSPEVDLIHLRFEPLGSCLTAIEQHDVGNSDIADLADSAKELSTSFELESINERTRNSSLTTISEQAVNEDGDEYLSLAVLIVLVVCLIGVIILFFLGIHTYKLNQDKNFELQVRLVQARQSSMYLSSLMLANQANGAINRPFTPQVSHSPMTAKPMITDHTDRKPVILDNDANMWQVNQAHSLMPRQIATQIDGYGTQTLPLKPSMTFALDSVANGWQPSHIWNDSAFFDEQKRSMTLYNRTKGRRLSQLSQQASLHNIQHSQSIIAEPPLAATPVHFLTGQGMPVMYTPIPSMLSTQFRPPEMIPQLSHRMLNSNGIAPPAIRPKPTQMNENFEQPTNNFAVKTKVNNGYETNLATVSDASTHSSSTTTMNQITSKYMI